MAGEKTVGVQLWGVSATTSLTAFFRYGIMAMRFSEQC